MAPFVRRNEHIFSLCLCDIESIMSASIDSSPKATCSNSVGHSTWTFYLQLVQRC